MTFTHVQSACCITPSAFWVLMCAFVYTMWAEGMTLSSRGHKGGLGCNKSWSMFALYNHTVLWSCTNACSLSGLQINGFGKQTNHTYGETCCKCATNCGLHTRIRAVLVVLLLCAHILTIACVTEELKCKLLILFCSRGKPEKEMTWNCECEILFESCTTSHGSTENVCQDCHMEMSEILLLWSFLAFISHCDGEAAFSYS